MSNPEYELIINNDSQTDGYAMIFCEQPDSGGLKLRTYAWQTKFLYSGVQALFKWQIQWGFMWRQTDAAIASQQVVPADPESTNQIELQYDSEHQAFRFSELSQGNERGCISIIADSSVPLNTVEVGLALAGNPTCMTVALPNTVNIFKPRPCYWLVFSETNETGPVDIASLTNAVAINFQANIYSLTATIQKDGTITVENTPLALEEQVE